MPITKLGGKRIAIDANNWMYTNMAIARKKVVNNTNVLVEEPNVLEIRREWYLLALNFIIGFLTNNITPVFIFDGKHPIEKEATKAKRREDRQILKDKIDNIYKQIAVKEN